MLIETVLNLFMIRKMDDIHKRSPRSFWIVFWAMWAVGLAILWWAFTKG